MVNYACGFNQSEKGKYFLIWKLRVHHLVPNRNTCLGEIKKGMDIYQNYTHIFIAIETIETRKLCYILFALMFLSPLEYSAMKEVG